MKGIKTKKSMDEIAREIFQKKKRKRKEMIDKIIVEIFQKKKRRS